MSNSADSDDEEMGEATFPELVARVYAKAEKRNIMLRPFLLFMTDITVDITQIYMKFRTPTKEFVDKTAVKLIVSKVPNTMKINGMNVRNILSENIHAINDGQVMINELSADICREITMKPPNRMDKEFHDSYNQWSNNRASKTHAKLILKKLEFMIVDYAKIAGQFHKEMDIVRELTPIFEANFDTAKTMCESLPLAPELQEFEKMAQFLPGLLSKQTTLIDHLKNVKEILKAYNENRFFWAELLIGMREGFTHRREPVLSTTKKVMKIARYASQKCLCAEGCDFDPVVSKVKKLAETANTDIKYGLSATKNKAKNIARATKNCVYSDYAETFDDDNPLAMKVKNIAKATTKRCLCTDIHDHM